MILLAITLLTAEPFVRYHPNCQVAERGNLVNGLRDGVWMTWSLVGAKTSEGPYVRGKREGVWTYYAETGEKELSGPFTNDYAEGTFDEFSVSGNRWRQSVFKHGLRTAAAPKACLAKHGRWVVDYKLREEGCAMDNKREGLWLTFHDDGSKKSVAMFEAGKLSGKLSEWHASGALFHEGDYLRGLPTGTHRFLNEHGDLLGESSIIAGNGVWKRYAPTGKVVEEFTLKEARYDGVFRFYYDNGALKEEVHYEGGETHGEFRAWHSQGALKWSGQYEHDQRVGQWTGYYNNGQLQFTGMYVNDLEEGAWRFFTWSGRPLASGDMIKGKRAGPWSLYADDGVLQQTGSYSAGKMNGKWTDYWATGERWRDVTYVDDAEVGEAPAMCARRGGKWVRDGSARKLGCEVCRAAPDDSISMIGVGPWKWWFPNGELERAGTLADGKPVGSWQQYFDNGQVKTSGGYVAGKEEGPWTGFYRDGQPRFTGRYKGGAADGEWESFHANGKVLSRGRYQNGKRVGPWSYFDPSGAPQASSQPSAGE